MGKWLSSEMKLFASNGSRGSRRIALIWMVDANRGGFLDRLLWRRGDGMMRHNLDHYVSVVKVLQCIQRDGNRLKGDHI